MSALVCLPPRRRWPPDLSDLVDWLFPLLRLL